jgi:hypothetical protein
VAAEAQDATTLEIVGDGLNKLVNLYEEALKESVDERSYSARAREELMPMVAGAIYANLGDTVELGRSRGARRPNLAETAFLAPLFF